MSFRNSTSLMSISDEDTDDDLKTDENIKSTSGTLHVNVLEGKNLSKSCPDHSHTALYAAAGSIEAYCVVKVGKLKYHTSVKPNDLNPKWNEGPFVFPNVRTNQHLVVAIRNKSLMRQGHSMGKAIIPISELATTCSVASDSKPQTNELTVPKSSRLSGSLSLSADNLKPKEYPLVPHNDSTYIVGSVVLQIAFQPDIDGKTSLNSSQQSTPASERAEKQHQESPSNSSDESKDGPLQQAEVTPKETKPDLKSSSIVRALLQAPSCRVNKNDKKNQSFRKLFGLPDGEAVFDDFSAALSTPILHHGRLYFSQHYLCFYSNIFGVKVTESVNFMDVRSMQKENKSGINPGITITLKDDRQIHFASFLNRESAYSAILNQWKLCNGIAVPGVQSQEDNKIPEQTEPAEETQEDDQEEDELTSIVLSTQEDANNNFLRDKDKLEEILVADFPVSVVKFFKMFFSDESNFGKTYHQKRGDKDLTIEKWSSHTEYGYWRTLSYRAPVKASIGPSTTRLEETQRYHLQKERCVIEIVSVMHDIPYGDYFRVESKQEIVSTGENKCRMTVSVGVHFFKKTLFEGKIKAGTMKESKESFETWVNLAREEINATKAKKFKAPSSITITPPPTETAGTVQAKAEPVVYTPKPSLTINTTPQTVLLVILTILCGILILQVMDLSGRVSFLEENLTSAMHQLEHARQVVCESQHPLPTHQHEL